MRSFPCFFFFFSPGVRKRTLLCSWDDRAESEAGRAMTATGVSLRGRNPSAGQAPGTPASSSDCVVGAGLALWKSCVPRPPEPALLSPWTALTLRWGTVPHLHLSLLFQ